jgi:hypothetical protein
MQEMTKQSVMSDPLWLGSLAVLGVSIFMVLRSRRFFGRKLSLEEALSVCWVAWSIYIGAYVAYLGLKLPLGLSRNANAPAVGVAVCISLIAVFCLARVPTNWESAVTKSLFGLFTFTLAVVGTTLILSLNARH